MDEAKELALQKALASAAKEDRTALAELLVEWIQPNHITEDIISMFLNTRSLKPGDALVKKVRKGIEVRVLTPGAVHLASEITVSDRINYVLSGADIRVHANEWDLESGELGTVQSIRSEMLAKLHDYYVGAVFNALATLWNPVNTPLFYAAVPGAVTAAALQNMINTITYYAGGVKAIVASQWALNPMTQFAGYVPYQPTPASWGVGIPSTLEEIQKTGRVGTYYGVSNIIGLRQIWDNPEDYNPFIPTDIILIIGDNAGDFITFGDVRTKEWTNMEPTPPLWNTEIYQQWGMIIDRIQNIGIIRIT